LVFSSDCPRADPMRSAGVASTTSPACNEGATQRQAAIRGNQKQSSPRVSREHNLASAQSRECTISPLESSPSSRKICPYSLATVVLPVGWGGERRGEHLHAGRAMSVQLGDGRLTGTRVAHEDAIEAHL
jgi:hypothetical protein